LAATNKSWAEFLQSTPPEIKEWVSELATTGLVSASRLFMETPDLLLHCPSDVCGGPRHFGYADPEPKTFVVGHASPRFINYRCRNCRKSTKIYAVLVQPDQVGGGGTAYKLGEAPPFGGPPIPSRILALLGPDSELFFLGLKAESKALGMGAFAYYRRLVENQKGRIIREIAKVAKRLGATPDVMKSFQLAESETQFSKAISEIKDGIPTVLMVDGHNPLTLLHNALSEGLHADTDKECLELSGSIRLVLTDLADRLSHVLKDDAQLKQAVAKLLEKKKGQDEK
jgi:hypothetical protein